MQAGQDARTLASKVIGVTTGGTVQGLTWHDRTRGGGRSGGGGGGGAQHILIDNDVLHLVVELVVADFVGTGFALSQEALLSAHYGGRRGHHRPGRPCHVQGQVTAGLIDDYFAFTSAIPCYSGRGRIARLGDGHRALSGELLRLDDLDGVHGDGDGLAPEAGHSQVGGGAVALISTGHSCWVFCKEEQIRRLPRSQPFEGTWGRMVASMFPLRDPP